MISSFIYDVKTKVYFGDFSADDLGSEIKALGNKLCLIFGGDHIKDDGIYDLVYEAKRLYDFEIVEFRKIKPNPRNTDIDEGIAFCKAHHCDVVLAIGGGSCLDSAKAIATGATLDCPIWDVVTGKVKATGALPLLVISTMSATGSDMNMTSVVSNLELNDKKGFKTYYQRPKVAFLNPKYTYGVSKYQTACGTLDILCHILETYFSKDGPMYMLDRVMEALIDTVLKYGPIAYNNPKDYDARANLQWAASWAINDFIRTDKSASWAMHNIEHEFSAYYDITHGLGLAIIMPRYLRYIIDDLSAVRFRNLAINVYHMDPTLDDITLANKVIDEIEKWSFEVLEISSCFSDINIDDKYFDVIASKLANDNGYYTRGYRKLAKEDLIKILNNCL